MTTNDFDPTKNRVPFGLMSKEEQESLKAWPHGWESWTAYGEWVEKQDTWNYFGVYRGKPKPVVTSVYRNIAPSVANFLSRAAADRFVCPDRIAVLRIDTCNGVSTAHLEEI